MEETHEIVGPARGEPQRADQPGARVRVPLDSAPSQRWSRSLAGHLSNELTGHPAVGYLRLDAVVQGSEIVLEGVEAGEAELLGPALLDAIAATNGCRCGADDASRGPLSMEPDQAQSVARTVSAAWMGRRPRS